MNAENHTRCRYTAEWILPIADDPIRGGWVSIENGRISGLGADAPPPDSIDLGPVALLPSLVNAHTHLELSYLRGRVPSGHTFDGWIRALMALRREYPDPAAAEIVESARSAIAEARSSGTGLVGDISNTLVDVPLLREARMPAQVFHELLGFTGADPAARVRDARARIDALLAAGATRDVRIGLAPHAPYSVSPALFAAIRDDLDAHAGDVSSVHLGESEVELQLLRTAGGPLRRLLEELGVWNEAWEPPRVSPVAYLSDLGFVDSRVLVVHGVQFEGDDLKRLHATGTTLVSCPRSNQHVGAGPPPIEAFYAMDVRVAFGTDSLASVEDLDMFAELAAARRLAPRVPAARLLESATLGGARALAFEDDYGSIEPGKLASLIAVPVPAGVPDVEEYLVSGAPSGAVTWLDDGERAHTD